MFPDQPNPNSLDVPPLAEQNPAAVEVLRVWAASDSPQQFVLRTTWRDPAAWGLLLVDVARHVAKAYEGEGLNPKEVLDRIQEIWNLEWTDPTDQPLDISPRP